MSAEYDSSHIFVLFYQKTSTPETYKATILVRNKRGKNQRKYPAKGGRIHGPSEQDMYHEIIEKCDARQDTGLQYKHKEITHISRRRAIKNTRPFAM